MRHASLTAGRRALVHSATLCDAVFGWLTCRCRGTGCTRDNKKKESKHDRQQGQRIRDGTIQA